MSSADQRDHIADLNRRLGVAEARARDAEAKVAEDVDTIARLEKERDESDERRVEVERRYHNALDKAVRFEQQRDKAMTQAERFAQTAERLMTKLEKAAGREVTS